MRQNQRITILDAALSVLADDSHPSLTFENVASRAGMTKQSVLYHFPSRDELMRGVIDHAAGALEQSMINYLGKQRDEASAAERIGAYVALAVSDEKGRSSFATWSEAAMRVDMRDAWAARLAPWLSLEDVASSEERARLEVARLAADGFWTAASSGILPPLARDRTAILELINTLCAVPSRMTSLGKETKEVSV